jgi:hypothetical protein
MAYPTATNDQITDAITQTNVKVLGEAPTIAIANQILALSQAHSLMAYNAVNQQQQTQMISLSSTVDSIDQLATVSSEMLGDLATKVSRSEQSIIERLIELEALLKTSKSSHHS